MDRIICCHSTKQAVKHDKLYRCDGCGSLWHKSCYTNHDIKNGWEGCCKNRGVGEAFNDETAFMMRNANKSYRDRQ